jgi:hypothetical protein
MNFVRILVGSSIVAAALVSYGVAPGVGAQEGGGAGCDLDPVTLDCHVEIPVPGPSQPGGQGGQDNDSQSGGGSGGRDTGPTAAETAGLDPSCARYVVSGAAADPYRAEFPDAPPDQNFYVCRAADGSVTVDLAPPDAEPAPPDPAQVAATMLAEAQAQMRAPEVVADPPVGTPSIITLPVFVQVTNWVGRIDVGPNCVGPVCVTLTAEPTLTFDPGEPGSEPIVCEPPGTRFDPNGPDPEVQAAAPGACAHAYRARTGADERPEAWPGQVTVTWDVSWTAGDASGEFDPQALSTALPREVDEVQTVVRDSAG